MVLWEIYFRHGLCGEMTRKRQGSRSAAKKRKAEAGAAYGASRSHLPRKESYGFSELGLAGLRLRSTATASRLTGFETSRAPAS
jgi:hypothetical protein